MALVLSALVVLISPMGEMLGVRLPMSAATRSWILLGLTTPIVVWCGWIFVAGGISVDRLPAPGHVGAYRGWRPGAYLASVYLTIIGSNELFYEAAAMLVTFVLFGHWMEMKSRRGSSDALHALFKLVPPNARVLRADREVEISTTEVIRDDLVLLRPGDRVPVDGELVEGTTSIDESLVTSRRRLERL